MREYSFNIFCQDTSEFKQLMTTCDSYYCELREQGIGAEAKPTEALTDDETEMLWASGVLNSTTPEGLLNAVFFCNGNFFFVVVLNIANLVLLAIYAIYSVC